MFTDKFLILQDVKSEETIFIPRKKIVFFKIYQVKNDEEKRLELVLEGGERIVIKGTEYVEAAFLNLTKSRLRLMIEYYIFKIKDFFTGLWLYLLKK
ncbi:MAG: hypothetical protein QXX03_05620 [Nitrososphaerota archaeon]